MKLASWNINGIRAITARGDLQAFIVREQPDILCLQETKANSDQVKGLSFPGYQLVLNPAERAGYSGTGMLVRDGLEFNDDDWQRNIPADIAVKYGLAGDSFGDPNAEGRVLVLDTGAFYLATVYTPNSKGDLSRLRLREEKWDRAFLDYMTRLRQVKPVVFCGDLNVAAQAIDLANPKANEGKHGFTLEERAGFANYIDNGFIDSFRAVHGDAPNQYTWWTHWAHARERNVGWRIDYFMVDMQLDSKLANAWIYASQMGSDHCPIGIELAV